MNFSNLKLGQKLGLGFGILIAISAFLGILAIINMQNVSSEAKKLDSEYIPEVKIANEIERASQVTMYNMRGYAFTEEKEYLDLANDNMNEIKQSLIKADELLATAKNLDKLKENVSILKTDVTQYENLMHQTQTLNEKLASLRNDMDEAATEFMKNCNAYLDFQNSLFENSTGSKKASSSKTLLVLKINTINKIIDKGNALRVANFKYQALRDPNNYKTAIDAFDISAEIQIMRPITILTEGITNLNEIEKSSKIYKSSMQAFLVNWLEREKVSAERGKIRDLVLVHAKEVALAGINHTESIAENAVLLLGSSSIIMIIGLLIAMVVGILLAMYITRLITEPVRKGVEFAIALAGGDLMQKIDVDQKDEIGDLAKALTNMAEKLKEVITNIITGANNIASASLEMSSTSQEMSQGVSEQASSAEEVSASMQQMGANIQQNTDNAQQTERIARQAASSIKKGSDASNRSVAAMREITEKIAIVNEIAFQTNILALNAAVEAARAGEHGKGFAVVAAEVRKLAEKSAKAASEIDNVSKEGVEISDNAGKLLMQIVPEIEKTASLVQEISAASVEQTSGANQVNTAIQQLNQVTQQNAAAAEELASGAEELSSQAEMLKDFVSYFKVDIKHQAQTYKSTRNRNKIKHSNLFHSGSEKSIHLNLASNKLDNEYEDF